MASVPHHPYSPELVALELLAKSVGLDDIRHALIVEDGELLLVIDLDELLGARGRVGDIDLHGWLLITEDSFNFLGETALNYDTALLILLKLKYLRE